MYFKSDFCDLYFEIYGNGDNNILILPGWGDNRNSFHHIIDYFKDKYTIYIIDYPGFGKSTIPNKELTIYDYANMIKEFMYKYNIDNPIVMAHSFGGRIAVLLNGFYNIPIKKFILIDVAGIKERKSISQLIKQYMYKLKRKMSIFIKNKKKREIYIANLRKKYASSDYLMLPDTMHKTFKNIVNENLKKYIKNISVETLILWGEYDFDTPLRSGMIFNKKIKDSALIILPRAGHFSYIEYRELSINIIDKFMD